MPVAQAEMDPRLLEQWKEEETVSFSGWDFSHIKGRIIEEHPQWDYQSRAKKLIEKSTSVLDMGTGGGELFSTLSPFPNHTVAIEGYKPNVKVARKRLEPLGARVIEADPSAELPFNDMEFDLVLNRHSAFDARELFRILRKGGIFLTQQVGGKYDLADLVAEFESQREYTDWSCSKALEMLRSADFTIKEKREWKGRLQFKDVGALIYYLKAIPWIVENFSVDNHLRCLQKLQGRLENGQPLVFTKSRFLLMAVK